MLVDPADSSYMPSLVVVSGGSSLNNLIELKTININPTDTNVLLLTDCTEFHRYIEVAVKQCRSAGIDCKIHGLSIVGRIRAEDEDLATVPFLASDNEEEDEDKAATGSLARKKSSGLESAATIRTKVFVWGLNDKDQLGGLKGSKIKVPSFSETLSALNVVQVAGGSKSLFAVTVEGKIYACGEATNGRLGLGLSSGTIPIPRQITALSNYVVKKVAVHSGGRHAMALTVDGKVFSWGEGDDGKLGHFSRMNCDKPRLIEALKTKRIRDIACGSSTAQPSPPAESCTAGAWESTAGWDTETTPPSYARNCVRRRQHHPATAQTGECETETTPTETTPHSLRPITVSGENGDNQTQLRPKLPTPHSYDPNVSCDTETTHNSYDLNCVECETETTPHSYDLNVSVNGDNATQLRPKLVETETTPHSYDLNCECETETTPHSYDLNCECEGDNTTQLRPKLQVFLKSPTSQVSRLSPRVKFQVFPHKSSLKSSPRVKPQVFPHKSSLKSFPRVNLKSFLTVKSHVFPTSQASSSHESSLTSFPMSQVSRPFLQVKSQVFPHKSSLSFLTSQVSRQVSRPSSQVNSKFQGRRKIGEEFEDKVKEREKVGEDKKRAGGKKKNEELEPQRTSLFQSNSKGAAGTSCDPSGLWKSDAQTLALTDEGRVSVEVYSS
ncbi:hypothetical protein WMY93_031685 [Mugilogobius chulae]|uniref:DOC domain-containing protein n=1 Tax=Mugilogobius chulae TaxID=88201 RepID=A0AAW0MF44_9GOBI